MSDVASSMRLLTEIPVPTLRCLTRRLDSVGLVEHAREQRPTAAFGHCTDDAGRALGLAAQLASDPDCATLAQACLRQLGASLRPDGVFNARLDARGIPTPEDPSDDATARALWGLAHVVNGVFGVAIQREAERLLAATAGFQSVHPRAAAHAVLAGAVLIGNDPSSKHGLRLLRDNVPHLVRPVRSGSWPWPEPRLTYSNGLLCEALLAAGHTQLDDGRVDEGLRLLHWLADVERSVAGHFSFTPVGGRGPGDGSGFDQQPIEAWAMASACRSAADLTHDPGWTEPLVMAAAWFGGANDLGVLMWDRETGASYDGLTAAGPNRNEGTESTIALIGTMVALGPRGYAARRRESR
ncbi:MAG: glycosyltransferase [Ilumatobacteraceae bacterium]